MKTLYIIGNGFDLHHSLKTKYQHFAIYLQRNNKQLFDLMVKYYWLTDLDAENEEESLKDILWGDFENNLAEMEFEDLLDDFRDYLPDYGSDEFKSRDYHTFQQEIDRMIDKLTKELFDVFKEFILQVKFEDSPDSLINIEPDSSFLSFNYTNTLERYYGVNRTKIIYIHGRAATEDEQIILGHGINPEEFKDKPLIQPEGLSEEDSEIWRSERAEEYDYAYNTGRDSAIEYFNSSHKHTNQIIAKNRDFFSSLIDKQRILVLGHSISSVDHPYFEEIIKSTNNPKWIVSFFGEEEKKEKLETLTSLGLEDEQIEFVKITELIAILPKLF